MKLLIILLFTSLLFSCSPAKQSTKTKISIGAINANVQFPNGLYLIIHNVQNELASIKKVTDTEIEINLDNGLWEFGVIGWDQGTGMFAGIPKCFMSNPINLEGTDTTVNINASVAGCGIDPFKKDNFNLASGSPKETRFISCGDLGPRGLGDANNIDSDYLCDDFKGKYLSYRVIMHDIPLTNSDNLADHRINPVESACIDAGGSNYTTNSGAFLPIFEGIPQTIRAYDGTACGGNYDDMVFQHGLYYSHLLLNQSFVKENTTTNDIYINNTLCDASATASATITMGDGAGAPYIICNANQLSSIDTTGLAANYYLGESFDASGNTTNTGSFSGSFNGASKILTNLSASIFNDIGGQADIHGFTIKDTTIVTSDTSFGLVAKTAALTGATDSVVVKDISFDNINISNTFSGGSSPCYFAALVGSVDTSTQTASSFEANDINMYNNSNTRNIVHMNSPGCSNLGGTGAIIGHAIGYSLQEPNTKIKNIEISHLDITSNNDQLGAVVGNIQDVEVSSIIVKSTKVAGENNVGGIVGKAKLSEIKISEFVTEGPAFAELDCIFNDGVTNICTNYGGIVGLSDTAMTMNNTLSNVRLHDNNDVFEGVGGVIGKSASTTFFNSYASLATKVDFKFDGKKVGGLIGNFYDSQAFANKILKSSIVLDGMIDTESTDFNNNQDRGGAIGVTSINASMRFIVSFADVRGSNRVAGLVGSNAGTLTEAYYKGKIFVDTGGNSTYFAGGAAGTCGGTCSELSIDVVIKAEGTTQCTGSGKCSGTVPNGNMTSAYEVSSFLNNADGGIPCNASNGTCVAPSPPTINDGGGRLLVERKWSDFGAFTNSEGKLEFKAGNIFDPFLISSTADWNNIADDAFLLTKSYLLTADLDFGSSAANFTPIGTDGVNCSTQAFTGMLLAGSHTDTQLPHKLKNITIDPSNFGTSCNNAQRGLGIISKAGNALDRIIASVGTPEKPLQVENFEILNTAKTFNLGAIFGYSEIGIIFANVTGNIQQTGTTAKSAGGLVGQGQHIFILNSSFNGVINTPNYDRAGGLIGSSGTSGTVFIDNSHVKTQGIAGSAFVAGLIGNIGGSNKVRVTHNYVQALNGATPINAGSATEAGLIHTIQSGSGGSIEHNYVILNQGDLADGGSSKAMIYDKNSLSPDKNYYIGDKTYDTSSATHFTSWINLLQNSSAIGDIQKSSIYLDDSFQIRNSWE